MPMSKFFQSAFMSGELSPLIKGRVDIDQYYKGMQTAENVVIVPQGGLKRRPGTQLLMLQKKYLHHLWEHLSLHYQMAVRQQI